MSTEMSVCLCASVHDVRVPIILATGKLRVVVCATFRRFKPGQRTRVVF